MAKTSEAQSRTSMTETETKKKDDDHVIERPTQYSPELAELICEQVAEGHFVTDICRPNFMPTARTVKRWEMSEDGFRRELLAAREIGAESLVAYAQRILKQANKDTISKARERAQHLRWRASKLAPTVYADKVEPEHTAGRALQPTSMAPDWIQERITASSAAKAKSSSKTVH